MSGHACHVTARRSDMQHCIASKGYAMATAAAAAMPCVVCVCEQCCAITRARAGHCLQVYLRHGWPRGLVRHGALALLPSQPEHVNV
jgi:hypothetical protein